MTAPYIHYDDTSWESAARVSNTARDQAKASLSIPGSYGELARMIDNVWFLIARQSFYHYNETFNDLSCLVELGDALQCQS